MSEEQLENQLAGLFSDFVIPEPTPEPPLTKPGSPQSPAQLDVEANVSGPALNFQQAIGRPLKMAPGSKGRPSTGEAENGTQPKDVSVRVLIIHPDMKTVQILTDFLKKQGHEICQATNLAQAHALLNRYQPGLVVLDWELPDNGWQGLLGEIRQRYPNTKILLISKYPAVQRKFVAKTGETHPVLRQSSSQPEAEQLLATAAKRAVTQTDIAPQANFLKRLQTPIIILGNLAIIALAEAVTVWGDQRLGLVLYSIVLLILFFLASFSSEIDLGRLSLVLSALPIIRILSFAVPLGEFGLLERYLIMLNLLVITVALVVYYIDSKRRQTDSGTGARSLGFQFFLLVFLIGLPFGLVIYRLLQAPLLINAPSSTSIIAILLLITLLVLKELSSTQKGSWQALGRYLNIAIVPLLATFFIIVTLKIVDYLG